MLEFSPLSNDIAHSQTGAKLHKGLTNLPENASPSVGKETPKPIIPTNDGTEGNDLTFWRTFRSKEFEYQFRCQQIRDEVTVFQVLAWIGTVATLGFGRLDYEMFAGRVELSYLWTARVLFFLFAVILLLRVRGETNPKRFDRIAGINMLALIVLNVYVGVIWPSGHVEHKLSTAMIVLFTYCIYPLPLGQQIAFGLLHSISDVIATICFNPPSRPEVIQGMIIGLMLSNLMGIVTAWKLHSRHRLLFLAHYRQMELSSQLGQTLAEVKTLRGLIQVCAWCKQVHVEDGWQQIEQYVLEHSHATFTHGICPQCLDDSMKEVEG